MMRSTSPPKSAWPGVSTSALALQIVGIHHAFGHLFVCAECAALPQQLVHERGFAVVYMGDDSDIAQVFAMIQNKTLR